MQRFYYQAVKFHFVVFSLCLRGRKKKKAVCKNENNQLSASFVAAALDTLVAATPLPAAPTSEDPDFRHPIKNVTVPVGREAILACQVTDLGHYKVKSVKRYIFATFAWFS